MRTRSIQVVIAVHSAARPIGRAVRSVTEQEGVNARALVVCHGIAAEAIAAQVPIELHAKTDFLAFADGIPSPAGPFNAGLDAADTRHVAVLGSDDYLAPGALADWVDRAEATSAAAVLARVRYQSGRLMRTPVVRRGTRQKHLDLLRDRLAYRTAPLGLLDASALNDLGLRFTADVPVGEDLAFGIRLYSSGRQIDFARTGPAYVVGEDAAARTTFIRRSIGQELRACSLLVGAEWFGHLSVDTTAAVVTKLLRVHVFGALALRTDADWWDEPERTELAVTVNQLRSGAPRALDWLSINERALLDCASDETASTDRLITLARRRTRHLHPLSLLTRDVRHLLSPQAPLRLMAASVLLR